MSSRAQERRDVEAEDDDATSEWYRVYAEMIRKGYTFEEARNAADRRVPTRRM